MMECDIVWLSHGGPGSGRYPKGSGKKYYENRPIITKNKEKIYSLRKKPKNKDIYYYKIIKDGKKIANLYMDKESKSSININWINVKKRYRGKGYAQAILKDAEKIAIRDGFNQMTLEVPGSSPDALHIYEKMGFKRNKKISNADVWGGLTSMKKRIKTT